MRFIEAVGPREAQGLVARVYGEVRHDFALLRDPDGNSPFMVHSPSPRLLAGLWSVLYETVLVEGALSRSDKEAIAAAVSRSNDCPFCVEAHTLLFEVAGGAKGRGASIGRGRDRAAEGRTRELLAWGAATREPSSELLRDPPFSAQEAPEAIGTAFAFHYVNRMVEVFQGHGGMSVGPRPLRPIALRLVAKLAGRPLRRRREPGRTLDLLPAAELPPELGWARPAPAIAAALARLNAAVEQAGAGALTVSERQHVSAALGGWNGADPPLGAGWLERALAGLEPGAQAPTRLALLAALAPYRVDDAAVEAFRRARPGDSELIAAVAWSSLAATLRITSWLVPQSLPTR